MHRLGIPGGPNPVERDYGLVAGVAKRVGHARGHGCRLAWTDRAPLPVHKDIEYALDHLEALFRIRMHVNRRSGHPGVEPVLGFEQLTGRVLGTARDLPAQTHPGMEIELAIVIAGLRKRSVLVVICRHRSTPFPPLVNGHRATSNGQLAERSYGLSLRAPAYRVPSQPLTARLGRRAGARTVGQSTSHAEEHSSAGRSSPARAVWSGAPFVRQPRVKAAALWPLKSKHPPAHGDSVDVSPPVRPRSDQLGAVLGSLGVVHVDGGDGELVGGTRKWAEDQLAVGAGQHRRA